MGGKVREKQRGVENSGEGKHTIKSPPKKTVLDPPPPVIGSGPNTVSDSAVSNTELSEFFFPHRVPARELVEFLSAYYLCAKVSSPSFSQNSPKCRRTQ